ncbi:MAG: LON peptidase substrate-binding domain-containing protein [Armatimonadetes bacterium]|nr:LON peptidase substrate-binding domain-containing protein [Armatimonadota bacterium]MDE2207135.1 LON peptidase substrate-binding domain-containing protein [Armatimonadota bacterium]
METEPNRRIYSLRLFPLNCVLFPQFTIQLNVFEDRYKRMIQECMDSGAPFGVVLIRDGEETGQPAVPHDAGCTARIVSVERLDDGRLTVVAAGESRFRLLDYSVADAGYLTGRVEDLVDVYGHGDVAPDVLATAVELFSTYLKLLAERASLSIPPIDLPDEPDRLAYCIAAISPLALAVKQKLLETADAELRLVMETELLRRQIARLEERREHRADAGKVAIRFRPMGQDDEWLAGWVKRSRN